MKTDPLSAILISDEELKQLGLFDNPVYEQRILGLNLRLIPLCREFLYKAGSLEGLFDIRVVQGFRTFAEQQRLFDQGRSLPGKIVTNSRPGYSWHNYGLAFDVGLFDKSGSYIDESSLYTKLGPIGEAVGLVWGGRWHHVDLPHYQLRGIPVSPTPDWKLT